MTLLSVLEVVNYGLVLIYGYFLSTDISGSWKTRKQRNLLLCACLLLLMLQGISWLWFGTELVRKLYPLIVHLPLVLILVLILKKGIGQALASVCTAYSLCQLPRWIKLCVTTLFSSALASEIAYLCSIIPLFFLLRRYFVRPAHEAMTSSSRSLLLFASLPLAYYVFDYITAVYSEALHVDTQSLNEFLPTASIIFYVIFLTAYYVQIQNHARAELQRSMLEAELKESAMEIENLRRVETQTAIYQHDMRHHLTMISGFLASGSPQQAEEYIEKVHSDVEAISLMRFCDNELVNLLCSSFAQKAEHEGTRLTVKARLDQKIPLTDTELCSVLSNGLENALHAVSDLEPPLKWVDLYCDIRMQKLLIEIKNPYAGVVLMRDGLPVAKQEGHGFGCRSLRAIVEQHGGLCRFEAKKGFFSLRIIVPVHTSSSPEL